MASCWIPHLLALEVSTTTRQAQGASRSSAADPRDEPGKSFLGRSSHPRRTAQARHRCRPDFGCQVHGPTPAPTVAGLENVPPEPCRWDRLAARSDTSRRKIIRSKLLKTGRRGDARRSTFSWWRRASISASSEVFDRNSPRSIHLIRLSRSCIEHSSPDSELHAKRTGFTTATPISVQCGSMKKDQGSCRRWPRLKMIGGSYAQ